MSNHSLIPNMNTYQPITIKHKIVPNTVVNPLAIVLIHELEHIMTQAY